MTNRQAIALLRDMKMFDASIYQFDKQALDMAIEALQLQQTCNKLATDCISRQATYLALVEKGQASKRYKLGETWELNGKEIREVLDALPPVQPEHETGEWVLEGDYPDHFMSCTNCKKIAMWTCGVSYKLPNFCPNCGAEMEGEKDIRKLYKIPDCGVSIREKSDVQKSD